MIESALAALLDYGVRTRLIRSDDVAYTRNRVLEVLRVHGLRSVGGDRGR